MKLCVGIQCNGAITQKVLQNKSSAWLEREKFPAVSFVSDLSSLIADQPQAPRAVHCETVPLPNQIKMEDT